MADFDRAPDAVLRRAGRPKSLREEDGRIVLEVPFRKQRFTGVFEDVEDADDRTLDVILEAYGRTVVRVSIDAEAGPPNGPSDMLTEDGFPAESRLHSQRTRTGWVFLDEQNVARATVRTVAHSIDKWSHQIPPPGESFEVTILPDGVTEVPFAAWDQFFSKKVESLPLAFV